MAVQTTVYPQYSPRLVIAEAPATEFTVQEIINDVRTWEMNPPNLTFLKVIGSATGKEPLGGGVTVGITTRLDDAKVGFAPRGTSVSTGSVTTTNTPGTLLIDTGADFVADGVEPGATIINITDQSVATVISVESTTQIICFPLEDGTDNQFDSTDVYKIWNTVQVEISGGNLTAIDDVGADISAIFPTAFTQVVRTSSSSATLSELAALEFSSFNGGVCIDVDNVSGVAIAGTTTYPAGTRQQPVRDATSLSTILTERGLDHVFVLGDLTLTTGDNFSRIEFEGESHTKSLITINAAADVENCEFFKSAITGTLDNNCSLRDCEIRTLSYFNGDMKDCSLTNNTITLAGGASAHLINCYSIVPGPDDRPTVNMGGSGQDMTVSGYRGGLKITNKTGTENASFNLAGSTLILDATVTDGTFAIRGDGEVQNSSTGTTINASLTSKLTFVDLLAAKEA